MGTVIREATSDDLGAVVAVGHRTWPATYEPIAGADYVAMGLAKWWTSDATLPAIRAGRVTVAEVDGEIVGMAAVGPSDGHLVIWKLYVVPECQGRGLGRQLVEAVLARARESYADIRLACLVGNDGAAAFYRSQGFVELEREAGGHGIPDSVWMGRELGAES